MYITRHDRTGEFRVTCECGTHFYDLRLAYYHECHKDPNEVILEGLDKLYGKPDDWKEFAKELLGFLAEEATGDRFDGQKFRAEWTTALRKDL